MKKRTRKLIGAAAIVIYAPIYALVIARILSILFAEALEYNGISSDNPVIKLVFYAVIGTIWILPLMPLIRWMERPDNGNA